MAFLGLFQAAACVLFVPVDVIKERLQVQSLREVGGGAQSLPPLYRGPAPQAIYGYARP